MVDLFSSHSGANDSFVNKMCKCLLLPTLMNSCLQSCKINLLLYFID